MSEEKNIYFYFDFGSPASYLAWTQLPRISNENNAKLNMIPMLLGGVFKLTGNSAPGSVDRKSTRLNSSHW